MIRRTILLLPLLAGLSTIPALGASIDGVTVKLLGAPTCYKPSPMPDVTSGGTFYPRLPGLDGNLHGTVNPWTQWPFARFRGATYSALYAQFDSPGMAVYDFPSPLPPQTGMTLVLGTPDAAGETITFKQGINPVARIQVGDILATFGYANGLNLSIRMPAGVTFDRVVFANVYEGAAFEFANLNAACQ